MSAERQNFFSSPERSLSRRELLALSGKLGAGALVAGPLLAACSSGNDTGSTSSSSNGSPTTGAVKAGGLLHAALTGEPDTLDPATSTIYTGAQVYDNIFDKLVDINPAGEFFGVLAKKWTQQDDKTWRFSLVDNATFHNGEKFTGDDVKYTFTRLLDPKTASGYASLYDTIDTIEVTSPTEVVFHLKSPFGPFLSNLANNGEIVNQKAIESGDPARKPVGTGPFQFVEWVHGDHITLKKNPKYFRAGEPHLDQIDFRFLLVDQSRIDGLSSGELDWVDAVPLQQLATLKNDPRFTYVTSPTAGIPDFLSMNTAKPPFDKVEVRQAVAWALDREEIRAIAYSGAGEVGLEEVASGSPWFDGKDPFAGAPDVSKAKSLLAQAGYANGLTIEYLGLPQYPELLKTGEVVREQLKAVGITMNIKQVDVSVWFSQFSKGDYQITSAYQERTIDPDNFYSLVIRSGGPINSSKYSNAKVDKLIDQARTETNQAKRQELYTQIRKIVLLDAPLIFVHYETINYLMRKDIVGSTVTPTLELNLAKVGFTK
jgi:peptide/nickel transport system substrate-binding protein